mmetsp:Transcript_20934/g.53007  ORF Transcript_20934/g.53007 Transcript_20934/m.53007 type:complete len:269 (-) Transcript_20934:659-1465(-)
MSAGSFLAKTFSVADRRVVITGASSGFGEHFARVYASAGVHSLALFARRTDRLEELAKELRANFPGIEVTAVRCDVSKVSDIARAFDEAERASNGQVFNVIVNNAGVGPTRRALNETEDTYDSTLNVNLKGAFFVAQEAAKRMKAAKVRDGSIINISSIFSMRVGYGHSVYSVSKAGLRQMTRALALEMVQDGIRVNAISPGYFRTEMTQEYYDSPKGSEYIKTHMPIQRLGELNELNGALLLLSSQASQFMYGADITIDGGHSISSL